MFGKDVIVSFSKHASRYAHIPATSSGTWGESWT